MLSTTDREVWRKWYKLKIWKDLRKLQLQKKPFCNRCGGIADTVNHIRPHKGDWTLFNNTGNLESVCKQCHDSTIQFQEIHGYDKTVELDGWPVDPEHPFNKEGK